MVAKEQDLDTKLAELLAGGPGGLQHSSLPARVCALLWWGLGGEDWGLKHSFGLGEKELSCGIESFYRLV